MSLLLLSPSLSIGSLKSYVPSTSIVKLKMAPLTFGAIRTVGTVKLQKIFSGDLTSWHPVDDRWLAASASVTNAIYYLCFHRCVSVHMGSTPPPSHNTSTGPMSFPRGYPKMGYPPKARSGSSTPLARSGWGIPLCRSGWGTPQPGQYGVAPARDGVLPARDGVSPPQG